MSSSFEAMTSLPVQNRPSLEVAISKMVDAEVQDRRDRKTAMYLKISTLRYTALLEDVICGTDRNFTKDDIAALADCAFIRRHENLLCLLDTSISEILKAKGLTQKDFARLRNKRDTEISKWLTDSIGAVSYTHLPTSINPNINISRST